LAKSAIIAAKALSYSLFNSGEGSWAKDDPKKTDRETRMIDRVRDTVLMKPVMPRNLKSGH
jgi:hypothetical protein